MNDKQLRSFMTVAESKSFAQAAEKVFVSVPALKKQIDTLENEIDASLVRRSSQGVRLTAAGKYFYERCKHMLKYIDDTLHAIQSIGNRELNTIRIGYCSDYYRTQDPYYFDALCNFVNRYPDVKVIFTRIGDKSEEVYDLCINAHAKYVSKMTPHVLCAMQVYCII